jgi:hypothetical protein
MNPNQPAHAAEPREENDLLASTISTHHADRRASDEFQRVNVLFDPEDLRVLDAKVHDLKTLGLRWINRSLIIRFALTSLRSVPADQLASEPELLQLKK